MGVCMYAPPLTELCAHEIGSRHLKARLDENRNELGFEAPDTAKAEELRTEIEEDQAALDRRPGQKLLQELRTKHNGYVQRDVARMLVVLGLEGGTGEGGYGAMLTLMESEHAQASDIQLARKALAAADAGSVAFGADIDAEQLVQQTVALTIAGEVEDCRRASRTYRTISVRPEVRHHGGRLALKPNLDRNLNPRCTLPSRRTRWTRCWSLRHPRTRSLSLSLSLTPSVNLSITLTVTLSAGPRGIRGRGDCDQCCLRPSNPNLNMFCGISAK